MDDIPFPLATYTMTYGLDHDGKPMVSEEWDSPTSKDVDFIIKAGMLTIAQQSLAFDAHEDEEDDDCPWVEGVDE